MNFFNLNLVRRECGQNVFSPMIFEPYGHSAIGTQFLRARDQLRGETLPSQHRIGSKSVIGTEEADQAVHQTLIAFRAQAAISVRAESAWSTSSLVLNQLKLKRTVPVGKVPNVR